MVPPLTVALLVTPVTGQFFIPAAPVLIWAILCVIHFTAPFIVAAALWLWRPNAGKGNNEALKLWARAFGYMNLVGVLIQLAFPCSPPRYELIYGLTPANYSICGDPGGLARIDALFRSSGYTDGFSSSLLVFGAFPSLHSGSATIEALFVSHFFPQLRRYIWSYALVLYWSTMYLT
ncbi:Aureobasidin resistance protein Aur1 [Ceratobasidium sp. 395]|nr:Aureobasidin resistance protein Aur1 [Ceratobasidium sp. 395]